MRMLSKFGAWTLGTALSSALAWWGVTAAVHDASRDPGSPITVPRTAVPQATPTPTNGTTSTTPPLRLPSSTTPTTAPGESPSRGAHPEPSTDRIASRTVLGGSVTLQLRPSSASLVTATPARGYTATVWHQVGWLRVDFVAPGRTSSLFVTWNGHPPTIQTYESLESP